MLPQLVKTRLILGHRMWKTSINQQLCSMKPELYKPPHVTGCNMGQKAHLHHDRWGKEKIKLETFFSTMSKQFALLFYIYSRVGIFQRSKVLISCFDAEKTSDWCSVDKCVILQHPVLDQQSKGGKMRNSNTKTITRIEHECPRERNCQFVKWLLWLAEEVYHFCSTLFWLWWGRRGGTESMSIWSQ